MAESWKLSNSTIYIAERGPRRLKVLNGDGSTTLPEGYPGDAAVRSTSEDYDHIYLATDKGLFIIWYENHKLRSNRVFCRSVLKFHKAGRFIYILTESRKIFIRADYEETKLVDSDVFSINFYSDHYVYSKYDSGCDEYHDFKCYYENVESYINSEKFFSEYRETGRKLRFLR